MDNGKVAFSRGQSLNGEYFKVRYELLGKDGFVEFVREEFPHWEQPKNLVIAKNIFKALSGEELPEVSQDDILKAQAKRIAELESMVMAKAKPAAKPEEPPVSTRVHSVTNTVPGRAKQS